MKLRDLSFIGLIVLVIGGLQTLSFVNKPPAMPKDIHHTAAGRDTGAQCLRCHQAEALTTDMDAPAMDELVELFQRQTGHLVTSCRILFYGKLEKS